MTDEDAEADLAPWAVEGGFPDQPLCVEGFRVWSFRSVRDSGYVPLSELTALVGREQSGKTTLLRALSGMEPRLPEPYSMERDWPRGRRPRPAGSQVACAVKLRFGPGLRDELVNHGLVPPDAVGLVLGRSLDNGFHFRLLDATQGEQGIDRIPRWDDSEPEFTQRILTALPALLFADADSILPDRFQDHELFGDHQGELVPGGRSGHSDDSRRERSGLRALAQLASSGGEPTVAGINERLDTLPFFHRLRLVEDRGLLRVMCRRNGNWRPLGLLPPARRYQLTLDLRILACRALGGARPVLLLDAPGRAFKGGFRRQLRGALTRYSKAGMVVVYTARLPFYIELQHPEQVLVLSSSADQPGVATSATPRDGELSLRAALGMKGRSSFRIDELNLVVEGPTDVGILKALSTLFAASGGAALPAGLNLIGAGGSFEVASVAAFLGRQGLGVVALFDSDAAGLSGLRQLERMMDEGGLGPSIAPVLLGDAAGIEVEGATIEDLFPARVYLEAFRSIAGDEERRVLEELDRHQPLDEQAHVARWLKRAFESRGRRFPKVEVAEALERRLFAMESTAELDLGFVSSIERLFESLRVAASSCQIEAGSTEEGGGDVDDG